MTHPYRPEPFAAPSSTFSVADDLRALLEFCEEGVVTTDADFRFRYANLQAARLLNKPLADLVGFPATTFFPEIVAGDFDLKHPEPLVARPVVTREQDYPLLGKRFTVKYVPMEEGGLALFFRDITEDTRTKSTLEEAVRFRERLLETATDVLYLHDLPGRRTLYLNHQLESYLGYDVADMATLNREEKRLLLYHPDDFAALKTAAERYRSLGDNDTLETEYRVRDAQGEWHWFSSREAVFSRDEKGIPNRILGISRDVTEQHRILEISETSRARYRTLVNLLSDWLFETNAEGMFTYASSQVAGSLGYEPGEVIGKMPQEFMPAKEEARIAPVLQQIAATQASFSMLELVLRGKNGKLVYLESSGTPIYDDAGNWLGYRGVMRDITERKRAEDMLATVAEKQGRIAETLQRSLLRMPGNGTFPDVEVVTRYEPASDDALVGGDFFDTFRVDASKTAFVVGDVTGKGLEAATDTAEIKYLLRSFLRESSDPTAALTRLNRQILLRQRLGEIATDVFVCLAVAVLDRTNGIVRFAVAGAEPPLLVRSTGEHEIPTVETVDEGGLPLGVSNSWTLDDTTGSAYHLHPGDLLFLYSDGLTEARREGQNIPWEQRYFGTERLRRAVSDAATVTLSMDTPLPVAGICDAVIAAVHRFAGADQQDDVCVLLARYVPEVHPAPVAETGEDTDAVMVVRLDADETYTYVSPSSERFTGQRADTLLGRVIWEVFPALNDTAFQRLVRESRATGMVRTAEIELIPVGIPYRVTCIPQANGAVEIRCVCLGSERAADLTRELESALRERETALREREIAVRERESVIKEAEASREWQRRFLAEVLANVTDGRLRLCQRASDLPPALSPLYEPVLLTTSESLYALRRRIEAAAAEVRLPIERAGDLQMAVGEAAMNCIVHAGGGMVLLGGDRVARRLQVRIVDTGSGIDEKTLHRATLERGFTTADSLGFGFSMMYAAADTVYLLTGPTGTTIVLEQDATPPPPPELRRYMDAA